MNIEEKIKQKCESFPSLTAEECYTIIVTARALSLEECYDYLLLDVSDLTEAEVKFAELLHRRGRANGVKEAADKLFLHMSTRNGGQSALEYLKQCSGDFSVEVTAQASKGFQFNVTIPEPGAPKTEASTSKGN